MRTLTIPKRPRRIIPVLWVPTVWAPHIHTQVSGRTRRTQSARRPVSFWPAPPPRRRRLFGAKLRRSAPERERTDQSLIPALKP